MFWILIIVTTFGGFHYSEFGYGPLNEARCLAVAEAVERGNRAARARLPEMSRPLLIAYCVAGR